MITPVVLFEIRENESVLKHLMSANPTLAALLYHDHHFGM
jgi:hypothetical protein